MKSAIGIRLRPRRELGRTGFVATCLGIGDVADRSVPLEECVATVRRCDHPPVALTLVRADSGRRFPPVCPEPPSPI